MQTVNLIIIDKILNSYLPFKKQKENVIIVLASKSEMLQLKHDEIAFKAK